MRCKKESYSVAPDRSKTSKRTLVGRTGRQGGEWGSRLRDSATWRPQGDDVTLVSELDWPDCGKTAELRA